VSVPVLSKDAVDVGQPLYRGAAAEEDAVPRAVGDGGQDGRRHREHQGAGAQDDQERHRPVEGRILRPEGRPAEEELQ